MIWYIIILAIVMVVSFSSKEEEEVYADDTTVCNTRISTYGFIAVIIVLILFEGLRSSTVGTDTGGYCRNFMAHSNHYWAMDFTDLQSLLEEPGLGIIYRIGDIFSGNYISFLLVASSMMVIAALTGIRQSSSNFTASLFVYITLAFYLFGFAGLRQGVALSIYLLAYKYIFTEDFKRYVIVVLIAALFHKTIIVTIPIFFATKLNFSFKNITLIAVLAMLVGFSMDSLLGYGSTLEGRYQYYQTTTAAGSGSLLTLFSVCLTVFYIIQRKIIDEERLPFYDKSLMMLVVGSAIYLVVTLTGSNTELNRFAFYFQTGAIFLFAEYVQACKQNGNTLIMSVASVVHIVYFCAYVSLIGGISKYTLNPILHLY